MVWQWLSFDELSRNQLYEILKLRQQVFVIEQNCIYPDLDDLDQCAWHLLGWRDSGKTRELVTYARVVFPGCKYVEPSIGRVLCAPGARGSGLGRVLMRKAIEQTRRQYPEMPIRISAQQYLQKFYAELGFTEASEAYNEDGIPHLEMLLPPD